VQIPRAKCAARNDSLKASTAVISRSPRRETRFHRCHFEESATRNLLLPSTGLPQSFPRSADSSRHLPALGMTALKLPPLSLAVRLKPLTTRLCFFTHPTPCNLKSRAYPSHAMTLPKPSAPSARTGRRDQPPCRAFPPPRSAGPRLSAGRCHSEESAVAWPEQPHRARRMTRNLLSIVKPVFVSASPSSASLAFAGSLPWRPLAPIDVSARCVGREFSIATQSQTGFSVSC
jgi:hypothetical protein